MWHIASLKKNQELEEPRAGPNSNFLNQIILFRGTSIRVETWRVCEGPDSQGGESMIPTPKIVQWKKSGNFCTWNPGGQWWGRKRQSQPGPNPDNYWYHSLVTTVYSTLQLTELLSVWTVGCLATYGTFGLPITQTIKYTFQSFCQMPLTHQFRLISPHYHSPIQGDTVIPNFSSFHNASYSFSYIIPLPKATPLPGIASSPSLSAHTSLR